MIPMPIFIPSDSSSEVEMIYPKWVEVIACFAGLAVAVGLLWMITALILSIINDRDVTEKPHVYSLALVLFGLGILIIAVVLMLITGQKVTD